MSNGPLLAPWRIILMEQEKVVVKRPHSFAEESLRQGTAYYDYENNANVVPR